MPTPPHPRPHSLSIEARALACERGGRLVFSGLSFRVEAGKMLVLIGPNGAGKSSLLRVLAGLIRPAAGSFRVEGSSKDDAVVHYLGHADALKPALTLRETLRFWGAVYHQEGRVPVDADFNECAGTVGLGHALDLPVGIFSAGQRRRAGLARLLLSPRPVWLLDEPTSSLDREGEALLGTLMTGQLAGGGVIITATHQELPVCADQVLDLAAGPW
jgi:heme exporter protein A